MDVYSDHEISRLSMGQVDSPYRVALHRPVPEQACMKKTTYNHHSMHDDYEQSFFHKTTNRQLILSALHKLVTDSSQPFPLTPNPPANRSFHDVVIVSNNPCFNTKYINVLQLNCRYIANHSSQDYWQQVTAQWSTVNYTSVVKTLLCCYSNLVVSQLYESLMSAAGLSQMFPS